ncbi:MAG TPA: hypothetical protein VF437_11625 [Verrucomicrobiae bacterium]
MTDKELHVRGARELEAAMGNVRALTAFVGLDGFVDEILHVVDKRESSENFSRLPTIAKLAERLAAAAGQSTNIELVSVRTKLGGNGPIMANALASFGLGVTYLGNLGYPGMHPIFEELARRAEVHSIAQPGFTDALEFNDGKIMLGKNHTLKDVNWENIEARFGRGRFLTHFGSASLVSFVNWTMLPHLSAIWEKVLTLCPQLTGGRRKLFFDLCDPEKRSATDIRQALELIAKFEQWFDVMLGLNEKEAVEIGHVLGLETGDRSPQGLTKLALEINRRVPVGTIVVHPTAYALAVSRGHASVVNGPFVAKPLITTGAGDHFNSGFCLGKLLGFDDTASLLCGVSTSGYYVRTAKSPSVKDLADFMAGWK